MISVRKSQERGKTSIEWLESYHSFSFGEYYDPNHMNFSNLRVINDDYIKAGGGFPTHPHRNMEILTYVISGELEHHDSMGNGRVIKAGELQAMCAGTGIRHSEANPSKTEDVHLLQIWITPQQMELTPSYSEWYPPAGSELQKLQLMASADGRNGTVKINQQADLYLGKLQAGDSLVHILQDRQSWLQLISGNILLNGKDIWPGDGAAISNEKELKIDSKTDSQFLLFNL